MARSHSKSWDERGLAPRGSLCFPVPTATLGSYPPAPPAFYRPGGIDGGPPARVNGCLEDRPDELVFVNISVQLPGQGHPPSAGPGLPRPPLAPFVSISERRVKIPFSGSLCRRLRDSLYFPFHVYLFLPALFLPTAQEEAINRQMRPREDKQGAFRAVRAGRGTFRRRWRPGKRGADPSALKGSRLGAEDATGSGHKGGPWASSTKPPPPAGFSAATIGKLSFNHRLQDPQKAPGPFVGLSCPRSCRDTRVTTEGSLSPGL